ncbi:MAG TPA: hypothetical protein DCG19_11180, partial [Cryomorphaceae bacterium]|nr:hypothetical protein [Cryomorphaceae bacterium]
LESFSFYQSKDGYIVRRKAGVSGERIRRDPAFARTRENGREFGRAAKAGKLLRDSFGKLIHRVSRGRVASRLNRLMVAILQSDEEHERGERRVEQGKLAWLKGFDINEKAPLRQVFMAPYTLRYDRTVGVSTIFIPSFRPLECLKKPNGATHFRILTGCAELDFTEQDFVSKQKQSNWLPLDEEVGDVELFFGLAGGGDLPLITVLGMEFGQLVNSEVYGMEGYNCLGIVGVREGQRS